MNALQRRDRHRIVVTAVSGAMTVGAITATGWLAGNAARDFEREQDQREQTRREADRETRTPLRQRPTRTRVTTRYVRGDAPAAPVVDAPAPQPAPAPPPAPEPPPAPSSGS